MSAAPNSAAQHVDLEIEGMTCAACATRIERVLHKSPGIHAAVNYATGRARITVDEAPVDPQILIAAVERAGYSASVVQPVSAKAGTDAKRGTTRSARVIADRNRVIAASVLTAPMLVEMVAMAAGFHGFHLSGWIALALTAPIQLWLALPFHQRAIAAIRGGSANMDVLVSLGTNVAFFASVVSLLTSTAPVLYFESAATIITLVLLGKLLEGRAVHRSAEAVESLLQLQPRSALVERPTGLVEVEITELRPDDIFVLRAGEVVPADGIIVSGATAVDESLVSGESALVTKAGGDRIWTASRNGDGTVRCRVVAVGDQTRLAAIARLVDEAQSSRAPIQALADRVSAWFVPAILVLAALTFVVNLLVGSYDLATTRAVAVLVVACPCALGLATPTAIMVGMGRAARSGIMLTKAQALQSAAALTTVFVDKTGTLTMGHPSLGTTLVASGVDERDVLAAAAALEAGSEHPLARAVRDGAASEGIEVPQAQEFRRIAGVGVSGRINGAAYSLVSLEHAQRSADIDLAPLADIGEATASILVQEIGSERKALAALVFSDALRPTAGAAIRRLAHMGVTVRMLTGDRPSAALAVARTLGIVDVRAGLSPEQKLAIVAEANERGEHVAMVGDGINDAPALAAATVGIAIGSGTQIAHESADVTLIGDDLDGVADSIELSRKTMRIIRQNLVFAFVYNVLCIPLAMTGYLHPMLASGAMAMSSLCVVGNSLRLARARIGSAHGSVPRPA